MPEWRAHQPERLTAREHHPGPSDHTAVRDAQRSTLLLMVVFAERFLANPHLQIDVNDFQRLQRCLHDQIVEQGSVLLMPRLPDGATARTEHITARFTKDLADKLDTLRGPIPRSPYLEHLVQEEHRRVQRKERRK